MISDILISGCVPTRIEFKYSFIDFNIVCQRCGKQELRHRMNPRYIDKPCYCWGCSHRFNVKDKPKSKEHRKKISKTLFGRKQSDDTKLKKSLSKLGKPLSKNNIQARYDNAAWVKPENRTDWQSYRLNVRRNTRKLDTSSLENYSKRGSTGKVGAYHLDHKFSIRSGFDDNIPPEIISSIVNLEYIPYSKNCSKQNGCSITKEELYEAYDRFTNGGECNSNPRKD